MTTDDVLRDIKRDRDLQRDLVSDQCTLIDGLRDENHRLSKGEAEAWAEVKLYQMALTRALRAVETEDLADFVDSDAGYCLQRRNGRIVVVKFRK